MASIFALVLLVLSRALMSSAKCFIFYCLFGQLFRLPLPLFCSSFLLTKRAPFKSGCERFAVFYSVINRSLLRSFAFLLFFLILLTGRSYGTFQKSSKSYSFIISFSFSSSSSSPYNVSTTSDLIPISFKYFEKTSVCPCVTCTISASVAFMACKSPFQSA